MGQSIIGRKKELDALNRLYNSTQSEFIAVYGRRRVGKTFLIRQFFNNKFVFQLSGLANATTKEQLVNFNLTIKRESKKDFPIAKTWLDAFEQLISLVESSNDERKVIFLDELPWLDTPRSQFVQALEHFWNGWASARSDVMLITCGSATSWMIDKIINNHGGLHNRITYKMRLEPFTLMETQEYFRSKGMEYTQYQIAECYMAMGGIPYYLNMMQKELSVTQNIDLLFFDENALLKTEFHNLYAALFKNSEDYIKVVEALCKKNKGLTRNEIIATTKLSTNGGLSTILKNLENCGFIRTYTSFGKKERDKLYQLTDFYTLFYFKFIKQNKFNDDNFWVNSINTPLHNSWAGYSFEMLCLYHLKQIKTALGISGVQTSASSWKDYESENGAQIDLILDRKDQIINLCEMKFATDEYEITKNYDTQLRQKKSVFAAKTKTRKAIHITMVTTYGLKQNMYSNSIQSEVVLEDLFR